MLGTSRFPAMSRYTCPLCRSGNQREFTAEINIHFPGMRGINIPSLLVFPVLSVCIDCGSTQFTIRKAELKALRDRDYPSEGAAAA